MLDLNLHDYQEKLTLKKDNQSTYILCTIRKKYLIFQPEELIRQLIILYLIDHGYPREKIQVEKGIDVNGLKRRFDIVVYDRSIQPYLLIECKSHTVRLDQKTFDQIANYNLSIKAPFLLVCNGVQAYCCQLDFEAKSFTYLNQIPDYEQDQ